MAEPDITSDPWAPSSNHTHNRSGSQSRSGARATYSSDERRPLTGAEDGLIGAGCETGWKGVSSSDQGGKSGHREDEDVDEGDDETDVDDFIRGEY